MSDKADWRYWVAADEIDALRAKNERLRGLLQNSEMTVAEVIADNERLRDLLAFNGIDPDAVVESAKGAALKDR